MNLQIQSFHIIFYAKQYTFLLLIARWTIWKENTFVKFNIWTRRHRFLQYRIFTENTCVSSYNNYYLKHKNTSSRALTTKKEC